VSLLRYESCVDVGVRSAPNAVDEHREAVMNRWYDRKFEHVMLVYMFAWVVALLVTYILTK
jgi:hypothetical protein